LTTQPTRVVVFSNQISGLILGSQIFFKKKRWLQVSDKMNPIELVKLIEILNPSNKPGRITIITRMGAENMRVKLPHLIRAVRHAGQIVTWITDPMHGNTIKAPCSLKTRPFDSILVCSALRSILWLSDTTSMTTKDRAFNYLWYVPSCVYQFCPRHVNLIVE
jgi:hypothetical protein